MEEQIDGYDHISMRNTTVVLGGGESGREWRNKSFNGESLLFVSGGRYLGGLLVASKGVGGQSGIS